MIISEGAAHSRGWYTELEDAEGDAGVKGAWRGTGIHPFNPDAVLTKLLDAYKRSAPFLPPTTPQSHKSPNAPHNRRALRQ